MLAGLVWVAVLEAIGGSWPIHTPLMLQHKDPVVLLKGADRVRGAGQVPYDTHA